MMSWMTLRARCHVSRREGVEDLPSLPLPLEAVEAAGGARWGSMVCPGAGNAVRMISANATTRVAP